MRITPLPLLFVFPSAPLICDLASDRQLEFGRKFPNSGHAFFSEPYQHWRFEEIRKPPTRSESMSVEQEIVTEELEPDRPWEAHAWLRAETLAALAEFNEQCLEMLALQFAPGSTPAPHVFGKE